MTNEAMRRKIMEKLKEVEEAVGVAIDEVASGDWESAFDNVEGMILDLQEAGELLEENT